MPAIRLSIAAVVLAAAVPSLAATIELDFSGTVTSGTLAGYMGDTFHGSVFYSVPTVPEGTATFGTVTDYFYAVPENFFVTLQDGSTLTGLATYDGLAVVDDSSGASADFIKWDSGTFLASGPMSALVGPLSFNVQFVAPGATFTSGMPAVFPSLASFEEGLVVINASSDGYLFGDMTSLTATTIPEPSYWLVNLVALAVAAASGRR